MARVVALVPDLLFGSQVQGALRAAGHDVELVGDASAVCQAVSGKDASTDPGVLVVDLTSDAEHGVSLVESLAEQGLLDRVGTLGVYSHVDAHVRARAQSAGFDLVVPRSRMAREGAALVARLSGE